MEIEKLEEQLTCSICLKVYSEPRLLSCSHVFCTACLKELISKQRRDRNTPYTFPCPSCREETTLLKEVNELKPSFQTNQFLDILKVAKANQTSPENGATTSAQIQRTTSIPDDPPATCPVHCDVVCSLFCQTCNTFICDSCTDVKHRSHKYKDAAFELAKTKKDLSESLTHVDKMIEVLEGGISKIALQRELVLEQKSSIEVDIRSKIDSLQKVLEDRLSELVGDLNRLTERKLSSLKAEKDQVESKLIPLVWFRDSVKTEIESSSRQKLLKEKKRLTEELQQKLSLCQSIDKIVVQTEVDVKFSCSPFVSDTCRNYGDVYARGLPCASKCYAKGEGLEKATVGVTSSVHLTVLDYYGKLSKDVTIESIGCRLESESGSCVTGMIKLLDCGKYEITYLPVVRGEHLLHLEIDEEDIKESPFAVNVECPVDKLGHLVQSFTSLKEPCGVGFTSTGNLIVAEEGGKTISMMQPNGKVFKSVDGLPNVGEAMHCGIVLDKHNNIVLVDTHNHCVRFFSRDGDLIIAVGSMGSGQLQFLFPQDVAFNSANNCYYVVDFNNRIQVLNPDFSFHRFFGSYGSGNNNLNTPHGIFCDNSGTIYIADTNNHRIVVTNSQGKFVRKFKSASSKRFMPVSVAVDSSSGYVYVGEANGSVDIFSMKGDQLATFEVGKEGSGSSLTKGLFAMCVHKNGMLYVCDTGNNCVNVY